MVYLLKLVLFHSKLFVYQAGYLWISSWILWNPMAGSAEVARKQWGVDAPSIIEAFLAIQPWLFASSHVLGFADFLCRIPIWTKYGEISCAEFLFEPCFGKHKCWRKGHNQFEHAWNIDSVLNDCRPTWRHSRLDIFVCWGLTFFLVRPWSFGLRC